MKNFNTVEKGIEYLRETAVVEMLYDPMFVPKDPCQDCEECTQYMAEAHKSSTGTLSVPVHW